VTGQRADGASIFTREDEVDPIGVATVPGREVWRIWGTDSLPVILPTDGQSPQGVEASEEALSAFLAGPHLPGGARFTLVRYAPGYKDELYAIDTADIVVILDGELTYVLDSGEERDVRHGDIVVQNGVKKAWENRSDRPAMIAACVLGAERQSPSS
jgi:quercetin dioxygenase-like cupin family protein